MTHVRLVDHSSTPIPSDASANPVCRTRRSGKLCNTMLPDPRPSVNAAQKQAGIIEPIAAPCPPIREKNEPIHPATAVSAPGYTKNTTANSHVVALLQILLPATGSSADFTGPGKGKSRTATASKTRNTATHAT